MGLGLGLVTVLAGAACAAQPYAYDFRVTPGAARDGVAADVRVDTAAAAILLELHNQSDQVLHVEWAKIRLAGPDGTTTPLRPEDDPGWLAPRATSAARLFPFVVPQRGDAAARNHGRRFHLEVPVVIRREPEVLRFTLTAHVRPR